MARGQLQPIADVSMLRNVQVQVVPFSLGLHMGMNGPFTIIRFDEASMSRPIVFTENKAASLVVGWEAMIRDYERAFNELQVVLQAPMRHGQ